MTITSTMTALVSSFVATMAFAILFNVPYKALLGGGLVGMLGWSIYLIVLYSSNLTSLTKPYLFIIL